MSQEKALPLDFDSKNIPADAGAGLTLARYAQQLQANGGKLMLAGVGNQVLDQLRKTETTETIPEEDIFMATDTLGGATVAALATAEKWLEE